MICFHLNLVLTCREDLHVGNGMAEIGAHDAGFATNASGRPWIPQTTLIGLLRDGCRKVLEERACFEEDVSSLRRGFAALVEYAGGDSLLATPLLLEGAPDEDPFVTHAFTAVDLQGRAQDHSLRLREHVRRGMRFVGEIHGRVEDVATLRFLEDEPAPFQ